MGTGQNPTLYKGWFVLVGNAGDAGYAPGPTGMGTGLAIDGAYVEASWGPKKRIEGI